MFGTKAGYVERSDPLYFIDQRDEDIVSQPMVYLYAAWLARTLDTRTVVDLGCGRAAKLRGLHKAVPSCRVIGVDYGQNIDWCVTHHDWGEWWAHDLERPLTGERLATLTGALVICADVIEHLHNPTALLHTLARARPAAAVISTPDRDETWGAEHNGPPPNDCHVREWNRAEFVALVESHGLSVRYVGLTASDDADWQMHTLMLNVR